MSRPRIPIGGYGEITFIPRAKGKVEARTRFRDWDGQTRLVQATARSRPAAEAELKWRLAERNVFQPIDTTLTPDSPFPALVEYWLADLDMENRIAPATRFNYERDMNRLVLPAFRGYSLREIGVARCDALLKQLGQESYSSAKRACCSTGCRLRPAPPRTSTVSSVATLISSSSPWKRRSTNHGVR